MNGAAGDPARRELFIESQNPAGDRAVFFEETRRFAGTQRWPGAITNEIELILEEWITNLLTYGSVSCIRLRITVRDGLARIEIRDNGVEFNPLSAPAPDVNRPLEERPIGGLGIFMIRKLCSAIEYERSGDWNVLVIEKSVETPALASAKS